MENDCKITNDLQGIFNRFERLPVVTQSEFSSPAWREELKKLRNACTKKQFSIDSFRNGVLVPGDENVMVDSRPHLAERFTTELQKSFFLDGVLRNTHGSSPKNRADFRDDECEEVFHDTIDLVKSQHRRYNEEVHKHLEATDQLNRALQDWQDKLQNAEVLEQERRERKAARLRVQTQLEAARDAQAILKCRLALKEGLLECLKQKGSVMEDKGDAKMKEIERLKDKIAFTENNISVTREIVDSNTLDLVFKQDRPSGPEDFKWDFLKATLTFDHECDDILILKDVKLNQSLEGSHEVIEEAKRTCDLPTFVQKMCKLWTGHYPVFSEVAILRNLYAIDWLQEERTLRVMLLGQGDLVATLKYPSTYPQCGEVTLEEITHSTMNIGDIPGPKTRTLIDWIFYLEEFFGKNKSV